MKLPSRPQRSLALTQKEDVYRSLPTDLQEHSRRVGEYARRLAWQVMEKEDAPFTLDDLEHLSSIELLGRYHDLGKADIPEEIWNKKGPLSEKEWKLVQYHTILGAYDMLFRVNAPDHEPSDPNWWEAVAQCCQYHHERWDGTGYPFGLSGEEIPYLARIVSIADAYEAMTADRPYHKGMSRQEALDEIRRNVGTQFDPMLATAFVQMMGESQAEQRDMTDQKERENQIGIMDVQKEQEPAVSKEDIGNDPLAPQYDQLTEKVNCLEEKIELLIGMMGREPVPKAEEPVKPAADRVPPSESAADRVLSSESATDAVPPVSSGLCEPSAHPERSQPVKERRSVRPTRKGTGKVIRNVMFYLALVLLLVVALFVRTGNSGAPNSLAGYCGMIVLTESMQDTIPKGSLIITKSVEPASLKIGDDITFMANRTTTLTHRIVGITESYQETGERAFETKGTMNAQPDQQPVLASNVVGKVIFHSKALGTVSNVISAYWPVILLAIAVTFVLIQVLKHINNTGEQGTSGRAPAEE